ncbi:caspase family protein, partial [Rhizobium ruizarguesonis]
FLDACRNNPFNAQKFWMAEKLEPVVATRGLARIDSDLGSLIAFSTEPVQVALDGTGALSPYSVSFIKRASEPNKEIRQVLTDV